jgi:hypothetical protein
MEQRAVTDKLLNLAQRHSEEIAEKWYQSLTASPKTASYKAIKKDILIHHAKLLFENLKPFYFSKDLYQEVERFLERSSYIDTIYTSGVPLEEAIYAFVIMRRHLWLYANFQAIFNTGLDMYQAVESINRAILLFDYATNIVIRKYREMDK